LLKYSETSWRGSWRQVPPVCQFGDSM